MRKGLGPGLGHAARGPVLNKAKDTGKALPHGPRPVVHGGVRPTVGPGGLLGAAGVGAIAGSGGGGVGGGGGDMVCTDTLFASSMRASSH